MHPCVMLYEYVVVCINICGGAHTLVCMRHTTFYLTLWDGLSLDLELTATDRLDVQGSPGIPLSPRPQYWHYRHRMSIDFHTASWNLNINPHTSGESTLLTKMSLQSPLCDFYYRI